MYSSATISKLEFEVSCTKYCYRLAKFRNKNSVSIFNFRLNRFPFRNWQLTINNCQHFFEHVLYNNIIIWISVAERSKALVRKRIIF